MGMFFTLLYILTAYLSPAVLFGSLAEYHIEIIIAAVAMVVSVPAILESNLLRLPQTLAIAGMTFAVFASLAASGWLGGAPAAVYDFLPNVFIYFLVVLHCKSKRHLQLVILTLLTVAIFVTIQGWFALRANDVNSLYLYDQGTGDGKNILRLRGLSFISDPNDFSQVLVSLLPAMFFFWKRDSSLRNLAFVYFPLVFLVYSMYLTHSRGAILAMLVVIILAARRKIGTVPALIAAGVMFAVSSAAGWSGGRDISVEAGEDRMAAWAVGLELIRSHPIFGVGLFRFSDYYEITAHNTIVVCAAELGFVGLFFWVLFVFSSIRYGVTLTPRKEKKVREADRPPPQGTYARVAVPLGSPETTVPSYLALSESIAARDGGRAYAHSMKAVELTDVGSDSNRQVVDPEQEAEIRRLAGLMVVTLCGYLAAGWFLSRAYVMTLYIYGGMTQVLFTMAVDRGFAPPTAPLMRLLRWSGFTSVGLLLLVYAILRIKKLLPA